MRIFINEYIDVCYGIELYLDIELRYKDHIKSFQIFDPNLYDLREYKKQTIEGLLIASWPKVFNSKVDLSEFERTHEKYPTEGYTYQTFKGNIIKDYIIPDKWDNCNVKEELYDSCFHQKIFVLKTIYGTLILGKDKEFLPYSKYDNVWIYSHQYNLFTWQEIKANEKD